MTFEPSIPLNQSFHSLVRKHLAVPLGEIDAANEATPVERTTIDAEDAFNCEVTFRATQTSFLDGWYVSKPKALQAGGPGAV